MPKQDSTSNGFAVVETILVLVILGIIGAVGYWVVTQRSTNEKPADSTSSASQASKPAAKPGTLSAIDEISQQDGKTEGDISAKYETTDQSAVLSANSAAKNLAGAYDETAL